ncbi:MAG: thiol-disulfide oxidoreductase DCC family protein [Gemmatimonadaceae bacterium]
MTDHDREYTVVYDGECSVCERLVRRLREWDRRAALEIVASEDAGVRARFPWISDRAYQQSLQLIARDGRTWQGAAAIEQLLDVLPRGRLVSWLFAIPFARPFAERMYRWFARNRYRFGCSAHCSHRPPEPDKRVG